MGQTTIPFIDTQEVETYPHVPLAGAGLYLKGEKHSGGFLGVKLISSDISEHMNEILEDLIPVSEKRSHKIDLRIFLPVSGYNLKCNETENVKTN